MNEAPRTVQQYIDQAPAWPDGTPTVFVPMTVMQWRIWLLASAGKFFEGLVVFMTGVALPLIVEEFGLSPAEKGLVSAAPLAGIMLGALALGGLASLVVFAVELGLRTDIGAALATWRFDLKLVLVGTALVLAFGLCRALARPTADRRALRRLLPLLAFAVLLAVVELAITPAAAWPTQLVGSNARFCLTFIPILSLAPLAGALLVLRRGAPASPALAGAAAGLLAAASGALLYAFHCFDDSPLFVMTWYSLAALPIVALGALAGRRLLRW